MRVTLELGTLFSSTTAFDLRFFYPFMISHNYNNYTNDLAKTSFDEANNIMNLGLEIALGGGVSLTGQAVLDQADSFGESKNEMPSAYGLLANLSWAAVTKSGSYEVWIEGVYTNPYLYLNGKYDTETGYHDYNLDYIVGYTRSSWTTSATVAISTVLIPSSSQQEGTTIALPSAGSFLPESSTGSGG